MPVREVSASELTRMLSEELKKFEELTPPEWSRFVKTGASRERRPDQPDWWYLRAASILRWIHSGPVGVSRLRTYYGGRQKRGLAPERFRKGGGKIIRTILHQLEEAGLVTKTEREGRKITHKGASIITQLTSKEK